MVQPWQDVAGEEVAFGLVRIAGEDERLDAQGLIGLELRQHLVGVADDGGAAAGAGAADAGPQVLLRIAVVAGRRAQLGLAADAGGGGVQRFGADGLGAAELR